MSKEAGLLKHKEVEHLASKLSVCDTTRSLQDVAKVYTCVYPTNIYQQTYGRVYISGNPQKLGLCFRFPLKQHEKKRNNILVKKAS